jgi:DNA processing protein
VTARLALDEGREVMAVPGSVFSRLSAGPNGLLRAGATPAVTVADILTAVGASAPTSPLEDPSDPTLGFPHGESVTVDALAALWRRPVSEVLELVLRLELAGTIVRETDGRYRCTQARR